MTKRHLGLVDGNGHAAPTSPAAEAPAPADSQTSGERESDAPDEKGTISLKLQFPPYDPFKLRQAGPQVRLPNDRRMDYAEIRDLLAFAAWVQQAAGGAAIQVMQVSSQLQADQFNAKIDHEMKSMARAFDRAIGEAFDRFDAELQRRAEEARANVWWRRAWRRVTGKAAPAVQLRAVDPVELAAEGPSGLLQDTGPGGTSP